MVDVNESELGVRIRQARERAGLSQADLASSLGLDRTAVNKIESGVRRVSALELSDLADAVGVRMASFFAEPTPSLVAHRMTQDRDAIDSNIDKLLEQLATEVEFVDSLAGDQLGLQTSAGQLGTEPFQTPTSAADSERLAQDARRLAGLDGLEPVQDLAGLVGDLGLLAFAVDLGTDAADAATILLRAGGVSLVNSGRKPGRRRLALAHELGHYLVQDQYTVDWRVTSERGDSDIETRLDHFARAFLLPTEGLRQQWKANDHRELREIAVILGSHFRVDMSTLAARARETKLVGGDEANTIRSVKTTKSDFIEFGLHLTTEMDATSLPVRYQRAVLSLVRHERISRERALQLLRDTFTEADLPERRPRRSDEIWDFLA